MDSLFDLPEQLSPRLQWMQRHGISVRFDDARPDEFGPWLAWPGDRWDMACDGPTEDDALANLARHMGILVWNEETAPANQPA